MGGREKARQEARGKNRSTTKQKLVSNTFGTGFLCVPYVLLVKKKKTKEKEKPNKDDQRKEKRRNRSPKNNTTNNNLQKNNNNQCKPNIKYHISEKKTRHSHTTHLRNGVYRMLINHSRLTEKWANEALY
jgi:hypothetical protein